MTYDDISVWLNNNIKKLQKVPPVYVKKRAQYPPIKDTRNSPKVGLSESLSGQVCLNPGDQLLVWQVAVCYDAH